MEIQVPYLVYLMNAVCFERSHAWRYAPGTNDPDITWFFMSRYRCRAQFSRAYPILAPRIPRMYAARKRLRLRFRGKRAKVVIHRRAAREIQTWWNRGIYKGYVTRMVFLYV